MSMSQSHQRKRGKEMLAMVARDLARRTVASFVGQYGPLLRSGAVGGIVKHAAPSQVGETSPEFVRRNMGP